MPAVNSIPSRSSRIRHAAMRPLRAAGAVLLAWVASWSSLASDPEADIHLYPFF